MGDRLKKGHRLGPYEIDSFVAAGGMGEVYKARDTRLQRDVVVKRLFAPHGDRFQKEAHAIAALNHPNICQVYDVGDDYLVLEYIDGTPPRGPLSIDAGLRLASEMAGALDAAHSRHILHRDLKPGNILLTREGSAKLLDFGVAMRTALDIDLTRTATGTIVGTVAYMAPEQVQGRILDSRADIFSFGAVLYELLTGRRAFGRDSSAEIISAILRDDPPPLHTGIPAFDQLVARCLAKDASRRPQSMSEIKRTVDDMLRERAATTDQVTRPSIAVLPFADMSPSRDHEWFSDGLAEEIINALVQIPGLRVIARTSSFAFKGKHEDIRRIADVLGVAHVLEGSVRKAGDRVRVTAQLVAAGDGSHLWSERYDRDIRDVFAIQDEIATTIASTLKVKLTDTGRGGRRRTPRLEAYEALLNARHLIFGGLTPDAMSRSREHLKEAIAIDPEFAEAHAVLGLHLYGLAVAGLEPARDVVPPAKESLRAALKLDPDLPEAHALLGSLASVYDYDLAEAHRCFARSQVRSSAAATRYLTETTWAAFLSYIGRPHEAIDRLRRVIDEDPMNPMIFGTLGNTLAAAGRLDDAAEQYRHALQLNPTSWVAYEGLTMVRVSQGRFSEASAAAESAHAGAPWNPTGIGMLAGCLRRTGDDARSRQTLEMLGDGSRNGAPIGYAIYHAINDESDEGAAWLEKSIAQRDPRATVFLYLGSGQVFRRSVRWPTIARTLNLPDAM